MKKAAEAIQNTSNLQSLARAAGTTPKTLELFAKGVRKITPCQAEAVNNEAKRLDMIAR